MVCILNIKGEAMLQEITVRALGCSEEGKSTVWQGGETAGAVEKRGRRIASERCDVEKKRLCRKKTQKKH